MMYSIENSIHDVKVLFLSVHFPGISCTQKRSSTRTDASVAQHLTRSGGGAQARLNSRSSPLKASESLSALRNNQLFFISPAQTRSHTET